MFSKTNLGDEESEQSLPSWVSDHLGGKSYIDEIHESPSFPSTLTFPQMDTSSLTKEVNIMSQAELEEFGAKYSFPPGVQLRLPGDGETILSAREGEVAFYEAAFQAGLRLPLHPTIRKILIHYNICPAQLSPNAWRSVICSLVIWRYFKRHLSCDEFRCLYSLSPLPDSGWYYFKARPEKNFLRGSPSNVKGWKTRFFFASGDEWEFPSNAPVSDGTPRVSRSWGTPGKNCNKSPVLSEEDAKRSEAVFARIEPGSNFEVSKVLGSRTFTKFFAAGRTEASSSGGDLTSADEGEFGNFREDSVEYLGVIGRDIGRAIRRAVPGIPDKTVLRWLGEKADSLMDLSSGDSGSSLDSGSESLSDSELPLELRSDAMSARVGTSVLGEKGVKAKADKTAKVTIAKPPAKGVVIQEKRPWEDDHVEKGEPGSLKGKEAMPPPPPKRTKSNRGAINARGRSSGAGTSSPGGDVEPESMMSDASVARRLLTGVIPPPDRERVDQLSENGLVAKTFYALGQVVVFASSLALRSQENLHDIDFQMVRADTAELELVKAQDRALKAENRLTELSEQVSGSKSGAKVDALKTTVEELTNKLKAAKEQAVEDFKASEEFKVAIIDSAATYFSEGFEFCKRQLLHQFPHLGADVANMAMDPSFAEEEEAMKGEGPAAGVTPDV
ncbi:uncharacterized protein LOC130793727 isoform X1 [Actinidia eriantha]|uniref:uncharacterized protein LOC130793727 isoform X1 n=1 Tax=Actinidia eriantha TaxID=165200 RepID=UPI0025892CD0|nr:uncharacterized protein LOC130793727 isoform X1 [Actinidia eriantha]